MVLNRRGGRLKLQHNIVEYKIYVAYIAVMVHYSKGEEDMKVERHTPDMGEVVNNTVELVTRARQRTVEELNLLSSQNSPSYAAAISGNTPHVVLPNGITIVMRRSNDWSC